VAELADEIERRSQTCLIIAVTYRNDPDSIFLGDVVSRFGYDELDVERTQDDAFHIGFEVGNVLAKEAPTWARPWLTRGLRAGRKQN
jgi:hypothetical protein